jgi:hypothetical protein
MTGAARPGIAPEEMGCRERGRDHLHLPARTQAQAFLNATVAIPETLVPDQKIPHHLRDRTIHLRTANQMNDLASSNTMSLTLSGI